MRSQHAAVAGQRVPESLTLAPRLMATDQIAQLGGDVDRMASRIQCRWEPL